MPITRLFHGPVFLLLAAFLLLPRALPGVDEPGHVYREDVIRELTPQHLEQLLKSRSIKYKRDGETKFLVWDKESREINLVVGPEGDLEMTAYFSVPRPSFATLNGWNQRHGYAAFIAESGDTALHGYLGTSGGVTDYTVIFSVEDFRLTTVKYYRHLKSGSLDD